MGCQDQIPGLEMQKKPKYLWRAVQPTTRLLRNITKNLWVDDWRHLKCLFQILSPILSSGSVAGICCQNSLPESVARICRPALTPEFVSGHRLGSNALPAEPLSHPSVDSLDSLLCRVTGYHNSLAVRPTVRPILGWVRNS
jgi:hypothetical protein